MTNTYKAISAVGEHYYGEGTVDLDLSPLEEQDAINGGHLELVPRRYKVLSGNFADGEEGDVMDLALLKENEAALIQGGHIERVTPHIVGEARDELFVPASDGTVISEDEKEED